MPALLQYPSTLYGIKEQEDVIGFFSQKDIYFFEFSSLSLLHLSQIQLY